MKNNIRTHTDVLNTLKATQSSSTKLLKNLEAGETYIIVSDMEGTRVDVHSLRGSLDRLLSNVAISAHKESVHHVKEASDPTEFAFRMKKHLELIRKEIDASITGLDTLIKPKTW